ncbi:choline dehydrogenase [Marinomonas sp. M1K-6]|uniref:Choline dehydrogenase n=1 Tax=Marinomonas profundi TaxID=2726122 RepID=A0A847R824_9GAMM|nr:choline dehydrogenase [Marinomonas profundi]NLQ17074.1 choline dehydrogenase [Marinomonas profundi]UDV04726.1 choline dehydrogenase [Marinomonas profundi]
MTFDYIIVGAGAAGCVLANRLSEDPNNKVCLIEAGPTDNSLFIKVPAGIIVMMRSLSRNWRYWTEPQKALNNRKVYIPRGRTLGGSSAVNAMCYTRGHQWDFDHWESLGNKGWGYHDVLPIFKRSEHYEAGENEFHGVGGPLNIADLQSPLDVSKAFVDAGIEAGYSATDDLNTATPEGVSLFKVFQKNGERFSAARGYLHPIVNRPNLTVMTGVTVNKVVFAGKRATGVEIAKTRKTKETLEGTEIILSGGAINSPKLLKLSGVGPRDELEKHGIAVLHELPGVGENLQDHPDVLIVHKSKRRDTIAITPKMICINGPAALYHYIFKRTGILTSNVAESGGFIKSRPEENIPDIQLHMSCVRLDNHGLNLAFTLGYGYSGHACVLRPKSRGTLTLRDANPNSPPLIDPNLLSHPDDLERMVRGVKAVRTIFAQKALESWRGDEIFPRESVQSDEEIRAFIRQKADNIYHPVGTCKMGHDDMAVVDDTLKVHGLEGLRVVDASIMPTLIGGNTTAVTIMIAEKGADMMLMQS